MSVAEGKLLLSILLWQWGDFLVVGPGWSSPQQVSLDWDSSHRKDWTKSPVMYEQITKKEIEITDIMFFFHN